MEDRTRQLLEGLPGIMDAADVGEYLSNICVYASVHISRNRGSLTLPPKAIGVRVDRMTPDARAAYRSLVTLGTMNFIPRDDENDLAAIEGSIRRRLNNSTTVDGLMPANSYGDFRKAFDADEKRYFEKRDDILERWDDILTEFKTKVAAMLAGIRMLQRDRVKLFEQITKTLPDKESYRNSFGIQLVVKAFPSAPVYNPALSEELNAAIAKNWEQNVVTAAERSVISLLDEAFVSANEAIGSFLSKGSIHGRKINSMVATGKRMLGLNIIDNPVVEQVARTLSHLRVDDVQQNVNELDSLIHDIYVYLRKINYEPDMTKAAYDPSVYQAMLAA